MPSPFPCSLVIRECCWKKTQIEKKQKKTDSQCHIIHLDTQDVGIRECLDVFDGQSLNVIFFILFYFSFYFTVWKNNIPYNIPDYMFCFIQDFDFQMFVLT